MIYVNLFKRLGFRGEYRLSQPYETDAARAAAEIPPDGWRFVQRFALDGVLMGDIVTRLVTLEAQAHRLMAAHHLLDGPDPS